MKIMFVLLVSFAFSTTLPSNKTVLLAILIHKKLFDCFYIKITKLISLATAGQGVCFGDSGGPLILPNEGQVGINSFIIEACGAGYPDAYSSVFYHRDWILENAK